MHEHDEAALRRLEPFIGEWQLQAAFEGAPPEDTKGATVFEWALDGAFVLQRSEVAHPAAPNGLCVIAHDSERDGYTQHYFDSRGVVRLYAMTFEDGVWTLLRTEPDFTPLSFHQRYIGEFSADGRTIDGRWESSDDGVDWKLDFGLSYEKVG